MNKKIIKLIDKEISYLKDNGHRYKLNGDYKEYHEHQKKIREFEELKNEE